MSQKTKSISIVIPAYNEERHLAACLDSISKQTIIPNEVIVVDNNSTDRTVEIAREYPFVTVIEEKQQGIVYARNAGFNAVTSDIIGRIDADTILPPDWTERILRFYEDKAHFEHYAYTGGTLPYNMRFKKFSSWLQAQLAFRMNRFLLGHYILFGSNMAFPRSMWQKVKTHVCHRTDIHEDVDLSIHAHRLGYQITYQATLLVGTNIRRVTSDRHQLWQNLMLWPHTLRVHNNKRWVLGWLGALFLYIGSFVVPLLEKSVSFFDFKN